MKRNIKMSSKYVLFNVLLLSGLSACSCSAQQKELSQIESKYTIDLDGKQEAYVPFSAYFKNAKSIILETNKDCLIGVISELQVFDGHIYILDAHIAKSLYVFDLEGRFIRKIGGLGRGPGEYVLLKDFTIDIENRFIYISDQGAFVHKYQLDGTYVHSITVSKPRSNVSFIQSYNGKLYINAITWTPTPDDYMLLEVDPNDGKILSQFLPIKYNKGWGEAYFRGNNFMSRLNNPPMYTQLFMNYIVAIGEEISPYIELKSKYLATDSDIDNFLRNKKNIQNFDFFNGSTKIWNVHCFVENDDFIIFKCTSGFFDNFSVVFHKETGVVRLAQKLSNDLILRNISDNNSVISAMSGRFKFSDRQGSYEVIPPDIFEGLKRSIKNNEIVPDMDKADQLMKLSEESNPIIFFYEFK